jgi:diphthamide biosynthesis methyltransferase
MTGNSGGVWIRLTRSQIARVRAAEDDIGDLVAQAAAALDAGDPVRVKQHLTELMASSSSEKISTSLLRGFSILTAIPKDGSSIQLVKFAQSTGIAQSTMYRYLNTLVAVGLVARDPGTRCYRRARIERRN